MAVRSDIIDRVLVLTVDNPPVNALSQVDRAGLLEGIASATSPEVLAVVIIGVNNFIAGADIREFGQPNQPPTLPDVVNVIEACSKPVVAAIAGQALGGGLEVALACHFRVALSSAKLGLPEVTLGLVPGAGGTQRLPRLIGVLPAAIMISSGRPKTAAEALSCGLVDQIVDGDLSEAAICFAGEQAGRDPAPGRLSARTVTVSDDEAAKLAAFTQRHAHEVARRTRCRGSHRSGDANLIAVC